MCHAWNSSRSVIEAPQGSTGCARNSSLGSVHIECRASLSAVWDATHGHTGSPRRSRLRLVTEWAGLTSWHELLAHVACQESVKLLASAPRLLETSLRFFRGRPRNGVMRRSEEMGPPPDRSNVKARRYNHQGQGILYLSDCEHGAGVE